MHRNPPLQRVDRLTEPVVEGRYYLVPTVEAIHFQHLTAWPVIGPEHSDAEFFNFRANHYHIDGRFLSQRLMRHVPDNRWLHSSPLQTHYALNPGGLPRPVWRRRRCRTALLSYPLNDEKPMIALQAAFAGKACTAGKGGWICPHRKAPLGSGIKGAFVMLGRTTP